MGFLATFVTISLVAPCQATEHTQSTSSATLRGSAYSCWLSVSGPPMAPPPVPAVAKLNVAAINSAAPSGGWSSDNSYLFTFRNVGDSLGVIDINPGFCGTGSCTVPAGAASTDGKFYVGPFTLDGQQQLAVYDTPPTLENSWTVPAGQCGTLPIASAHLDSVTIIFNTAKEQWESAAPHLPVTVVADVLTSTTDRLYYDNTACLPVPGPNDFSVAYSVSFYNGGGHISIQRTQNTLAWWAVTTDCDAFAAVSSHLGAMSTCTCYQYTTEQYGCPFEAGSVWQ